ncbi:protein tyrosine phosphatase [Myxococcota bacterium]|nr:protein tyrosine phosphatase [Myxococcota bacterium]MBU1429428.1 protein tyrosine phosphatase [Myxococcota bacterium]MBU1898796.1 protein tyrosine phosphatase [Myxococcota bacterium]
MLRTLTATLLPLALLGCWDKVDQPVPNEAEIAAMAQLHDANQRIVDLLNARADLFDRPSTTPLTPDERAFLLPLWASMIDHFLAFRALKERFLLHWRDAGEGDEGPVKCLTIGLHAHTEQLRVAFTLFGLVGSNEALRAALNEATPEYGVSAGFLDRLAIEVAAPQALMMVQIGAELLEQRSDKMFRGESEVEQQLINGIKHTLEATKEIERLYRRHGMDLVRETVRIIVTNELNRAIDPVVKDIALWLGDTRVRHANTSLIHEADLDALLPRLAPGDIIVERRNWYLSNLGLPGFWPHSALFIGAPSELAATFDADPDLLAAFPEGLSAYLAQTYPQAWAAFNEGEGDETRRVIEAVSEGVIFSSLYHSCLADYVGVMRPRLTPLEKARAIARSFSHWGKPYDFDFDFLTQSEMVCSEVVYTSYQAPSAEGRSLDITLSEIMGRITLPPNDIVRQLDAAYDQPDRQLDFVAFLEGIEADHAAYERDVAAFRASWLRPKWDLAQE